MNGWSVSKPAYSCTYVNVNLKLRLSYIESKYLDTEEMPQIKWMYRWSEDFTMGSCLWTVPMPNDDWCFMMSHVRRRPNAKYSVEPPVTVNSSAYIKTSYTLKDTQRPKVSSRNWQQHLNPKEAAEAAAVMVMLCDVSLFSLRSLALLLHKQCRSI